MLHIEQSVDGLVSKVSNMTQLLLPFSAIGLAIRQASLKAPDGADADEEDAVGEHGRSVAMKLLVVQPKSVQKCKAVFRLGACSLSQPACDAQGPSDFAPFHLSHEYFSTPRVLFRSNRSTTLLLLPTI